MARPLFQEVQRFRDNRWIWIGFIVLWLVTVLPFLYGIYWQIFQGEPWGTKPMGDTELIVTLAAVLISLSITGFFIFSLTLEVTVTGEGLHYRAFPVKRKWQQITPGQIENYKLENRLDLFRTGGFGYNLKIGDLTSIRLGGTRYLEVKLRNGKRLVLGTRSPGDLERAMKKLLTPQKI